MCEVGVHVDVKGQSAEAIFSSLDRHPTQVVRNDKRHI